MGKPPIGRGVKRTPAQLSLVGTQQDSAPQKDGATRKAEALVKARAKAAEGKAVRDAERLRLREAGVPTPLERYRAGEYPISEWTNDEVSRGRPANRDGSFDGPWPRFTGKQQAEIRRELLRRGQSKMDEAFLVAIKTLAHVAAHGEKDSDRVKAADLLMQRVAGKVPDKVEIKSSDPWQDILDEIMDDEVLQRMNTDVPQGDSA